MNGGWPSDQQISFLPLLSQDRVEVAGCLDDWRADALGGGNTKAAKSSHRLSRTGAESSQNHWRSLFKLSSSADFDLSDKVQAACRTIFLCGGGPCSCRCSTYGQTPQFRDLGDLIVNYGYGGARVLQFQVHEQNLIDLPHLLKTRYTHTQINEVQSSRRTRKIEQQSHSHSLVKEDIRE